MSLAMATFKVKANMDCDHNIIGEHEFDVSKEPKPLNVERVRQVQQCLMLMGARKIIKDPQEAAEFLLHR